MKTDITDKKILYLLSRNCRFSNTTLAKRLHLSREKVAYRINRLMKLGIIQKFSLWIQPQNIGWYAITVGVKIKVTISAQKLLHDLRRIPQITALTHCGGMFDILFNIMGEHIEEAYVVFQTVLETYGDEISHYQVFTKIDQQYFGLKYLISEKRDLFFLDQTTERKGTSFASDFTKTRVNKKIKLNKKHDLDSDEKKIIQTLHTQARMAFKDISQKTGISTFMLKKKLHQLIYNDILKCFMITINSKEFGFSPYFVFINIKRTQEAAFQTWVSIHPSIIWCTQYLGELNYKLNIFAKDNVELSLILTSLSQEFGSSIGKVEYVPIFEEIVCNSTK